MYVITKKMGIRPATTLYELYICVDCGIRGHFHFKLLHCGTKFHQNSTEDSGVIVTNPTKGKESPPFFSLASVRVKDSPNLVLIRETSVNNHATK